MSSQSTKVFKTALDLAQKYGSEMTLLTCFQIDVQFHLYFDSGTSSQLAKKQQKYAKHYFEKLRIIAKKKGISINFQTLSSKSIIKDIVTFARSGKYDLIILGSHGRSGFDKLLLGSVANGVVQKAHCPVFIIK